jgi:hypothetical protein
MKTIIARNDTLQRLIQDAGINAKDLNYIDTSNVTSMKGVFEFRISVGNISKWDASSLTDTENMFMNNHSFNYDIYCIIITCCPNRFLLKR